MPIARFQLPDGRIARFEVPEGTSPEQAQAMISEQLPQMQLPSPSPEAEKAAPFSAKDEVIQAAQSALGASKSVLQGFGAETAGAEYLGDAAKKLGTYLSPERQAEQQRREAIEKAAAQSGSTLAEMSAGVGAVTEAPLAATAQAGGSALPTIALGVGAAALGVWLGAPVAIAAGVGIGMKFLIGALQGAGEVKGSVYDAVKDGLKDSGKDPEEIKRIARESQNYFGENWGTIAAATGIGAWAGGTGLESEALKYFSKPVAKKAAEDLAKKAAEAAAKTGFVAGTKRAGVAGLKEAVPEAVQGGQSQYAQNVAMTRAGMETPAMQGVAGAATKEGLMGMLGGAAIHPLIGHGAEAATPEQEQAPGTVGPTPEEIAYRAAVEARKQEQGTTAQGKAARAGEKILDAEAKAQADAERASRVGAEQAAAAEIQAARTQREAELKEAFPADYSDVMQRTNSYMELYDEKQTLLGLPQSINVKRRLKVVDGLLEEIVAEDMRIPNEANRMMAENLKAINKLPRDLQAKYAAATFEVPASPQMEMRAFVEQPPTRPPEIGLDGKPLPVEPTPPVVREPKLKTVATVAEAQAALDAQNAAQARAGAEERKAAAEAGQLGLFTRVGTPTAEAKIGTEERPVLAPTEAAVAPAPVAEAVTEPVVRQKPTPETVPTVVTPEVLGVLGIGGTAVLRKSDHPIQGLDIAKPEEATQVRDMLTVYRNRPGLSPAIAGKVDTYLTRPEFKGLPDVTPVAKQNQPESGNKPGANQPSVAVPAQPAAVSVPRLGGRVPAPAESIAPVGTGLVPAGAPAGKRNVPKGTKPVAVVKPVVVKPVAAPKAKAPKEAPVKPTGQSAEKKAANKAAQPSARKAKKEVVKPTEAPKAVVPKAVVPKVPKAPKVVVPKAVVPEAPEAKVTPTRVPDLAVTRRRIDDLGLDPDTKKSQVTAFAKKLHAAGIIEDGDLAEVQRISKDRDMGVDDILSEISLALDAYEQNQKEPAQVTKEEAPKDTTPGPANESLVRPVERLQADQVETLEEFYDAKKGSKEFWERLRADVHLYATKGGKAVAKAIRELIGQIQAGVLAVGIVFNPSAGLTNNYNINIPQVVRTTSQIKAVVPAEAKGKMSQQAIDVYEAMAPVAKKTGKGFILADKANGKMHLFNNDGSYFLSDAALYGKDIGDVMVGGGKLITPAGKFTLVTMPVEYAGRKGLGLVETEDATGIIAIHAAYLGDPAERRAARLESGKASESRISYGCINTKHTTFLNKILPRIDDFDGGLIFVLPDVTAKTAEMFKPETQTTERVETRKTVEAETKREQAKKEEIHETLRPENLRLRVEETPTPVEKPMGHSEIEGLIAEVEKTLGGAVDITILDKATDLDRKAASGTAGAVVGNKVYLFRDGIASGIDGIKTIFHELFHHGLQKLLTTRKYHEVMNGLYTSNARVRKLADAWINTAEGKRAEATYAAQHPTDAITAHGALISHATDEALARIAEELKTGNKIGTGQRGFVRSIASWLGSVAEALGLRRLAQHIRSATYSEVEKFVQEALDASVKEGPVKAGVTLRANIPNASKQAIATIQAQVPPQTQAPQGNGIQQMMAGAATAIKNRQAVLLVRQKTADKFATVSAKLASQFSQGYKNSFGDVNPELVARQAEEAQKLVQDFYRAGGIKFNKDGIVETVDSKDSALSAIKQIVDIGKASGMTYEQAEAHVSTVLEGHRLHDMRENHDAILEQSARLLEAQGKQKQADAERDKKLRRHMNNADIDTLEAEYKKTPSIQKVQDTLNATRTQAIDFMVAAGRITKETGKFWKDNAAYVPFDRMIDESDTPVTVVRGNGIATLRNIPGMKGSFERPIKNVIDSYTNRLGWMITEGIRNNASLQVADALVIAKLAEEHAKPELAKKIGLVLPKLYRDGKAVHFEVQSVADFEAFQMAPAVMGSMVKALMVPARWLRVGITSMPPFTVKQVIEDAQRAMFTSGVKHPLTVGMKTLYNFPRLLTSDALQGLGIGKQMPIVRMMEKLGIVGDYDTNIINPASDLKIAAGASGRGFAGATFHILERITKASDLAARLAVFEETLMETGGVRQRDGSIVGGDTTLAQTRARELINFSRRGSNASLHALTRVVPFMNAYAQGMDVTYRTATGMNASSGASRAAAKKMFYKNASIMVGMGFLYALAMSDDDGYKNATDEVRDNNYLIPGSDKKIPLPKEIGFLFKSIPERIVDYYRRYGTSEEQSAVQFLGSLAKGALSAYGPPNATPALIKPVLEALTNHSFFLQRELESASVQKLDVSQRATSSTAELAKSIGAASAKLGGILGTKVVEVSPIMVDNLIRGMFGMAGSTTLLMTDALLNPSRPDRPLYQMPFASLFLYDTIGGRKKNEFYDLQTKAAQALTTFNYLETNHPEKVQAYYLQNKALIAFAPSLNNTLRDLNKIRKERMMLEESTLLKLSPEIRRAEIDKLRKIENLYVSDIRKINALVNKAQ